MFRKIICKLRGHKFIESESLQSSQSQYCEILYICSFCGTTSKQFDNHIMSQWEFNPSQDCEVIRTCNKCGYLEKQARHLFAPWEYESNSYNRMRSCNKCKHKEKRDAFWMNDPLILNLVDESDDLKRMFCWLHCHEEIELDVQYTDESNEDRMSCSWIVSEPKKTDDLENIYWEISEEYPIIIISFDLKDGGDKVCEVETSSSSMIIRVGFVEGWIKDDLIGLVPAIKNGRNPEVWKRYTFCYKE